LVQISFSYFTYTTVGCNRKIKVSFYEFFVVIIPQI
jgi:hypothetical protein